MRNASEQIEEVVIDVLTRQATDSGKALDGGELVLIDVRSAASAVAAALVPKLQATLDWHMARHHVVGD